MSFQNVQLASKSPPPPPSSSSSYLYLGDISKFPLALCLGRRPGFVFVLLHSGALAPECPSCSIRIISNHRYSNRLPLLNNVYFFYLGGGGGVVFFFHPPAVARLIGLRPYLPVYLTPSRAQSHARTSQQPVTLTDHTLHSQVPRTCSLSSFISSLSHSLLSLLLYWPALCLPPLL